MAHVTRTHFQPNDDLNYHVHAECVNLRFRFSHENVETMENFTTAASKIHWQALGESELKALEVESDQKILTSLLAPAINRSQTAKLATPQL